MLLNDSHFVSSEWFLINLLASENKKSMIRITRLMLSRGNALFTLTALDRKAITKKNKHKWASKSYLKDKFENFLLLYSLYLHESL